ncbi:MAG: choice-of-anchor D domain-containing protein [Deltaproteobacteria bacterium]|nr:choice-of-anchor D domain-containing protein [Deltaproteobacteria bacterium]
MRVPGACVVVVVVVLGACQDESLGRLVPSIALCPSADAAIEDCDRDINVGDVAVTVPLSLALSVRNVGDGTLEINGVESSDEAVVLGVPADDVVAGQASALPVTITLPADGLGARAVTVTVTSDDPEQPSEAIELLLNGVPKPAPEILVCADVDGAELCGTELDLDFGSVRRTQRFGLGLVVKNVGTAPLAIEDVHLEGSSSSEGEIVIASSTRPAELAAGESAAVLVVYLPADEGSDVVDLVILSNDEDTRRVRVGLRGRADANAPPVAVAVETLTQTDTVLGIVDDILQVDASGSTDPESDPLAFQWELIVPSGSAARLDDVAAVRAVFTPDVAGSYVATVVVTDSLGQESEPAAVIVTVRARFGFRAQLTWEGAADVDLHLIERGGTLFGARDCSFVARAVDFGAVTVVDDDCVLVDDAAANGPEQVVIVAPAAGTYEVWAQLFDDGGALSIDATVKVIIDDAADPLVLETFALPATPDCAAWHVADVTFPGPSLAIIDPVISARCP